MRIEGVGDHEASDINVIIDRVLKDLGNPEPPLSLDVVRELLRLDKRFYSSTETTLLDELTHRIRVGTKQIFLRPGLIVDAIKKANISALWMPDTKRILIDESVPKLKHRWIEAHEVGHSLIPWHREFLFGDDEFTLDPACHAMVEGEANYAAGQLLFLRGKFGCEARDMEPNFATVKSLSKRYGNTITSSLWRMVQERNADQSVFGMVSCHPNHPEIGTGANGEAIRYFVRSHQFRRQFGVVNRNQIFDLIGRNASWSKRGTIIDCSAYLTDVNGESHEFKLESFCNGYALLSYGILLRKRQSMVSAA